MTKLGSSLPKGDANGLEALNQPLISNPESAFIIVAVIDCKRITTDIDTDDAEATARILRIEAVAPGDKETTSDILARAHEHRTGKTVLPLEIDDALRNVRSVDFGTGEIHEGDDEDGDD